ncbi:MAG: hypothetical protein AAGC84_07660 [Pseudomonas sp.]
MPFFKLRLNPVRHPACAARPVSTRRAFNFVGLGRATVLAGLLLIVAGLWHMRGFGLPRIDGPTFAAALCALVVLTLAGAWRFSLAMAVATVLPVVLDLLAMLALVALFDSSLEGASSVSLLVIAGYSLAGKLLVLNQLAIARPTAPGGQPLSLSLRVNRTLQQLLAYWRCYLLLGAALLVFAGSTLPVVGGLLIATASTVFTCGALWLTLQQRRITSPVPTRYRAALDGRVFLAGVAALVLLGLASWL